MCSNENLSNRWLPYLVEEMVASDAIYHQPQLTSKFVTVQPHVRVKSHNLLKKSEVKSQGITIFHLLLFKNIKILNPRQKTTSFTVVTFRDEFIFFATFMVATFIFCDI